MSALRFVCLSGGAACRGAVAIVTMIGARAAPSRAAPSRAAPSRAAPSSAAPSRAAPSVSAQASRADASSTLDVLLVGSRRPDLRRRSLVRDAPLPRALIGR
jgi:hypothetical protein